MDAVVDPASAGPAEKGRTPCRVRRRPSPAFRGDKRGRRPFGYGKGGHGRPSPSSYGRRSPRPVRRGTVHWTVPSSSSPPVELVGPARIETQRDVGRGRSLGFRLRPLGRRPPHGVVATFMAKGAQLFEDADAGQALPLRPARVLRQHPVDLGPPGADLRLRLRLDAALVGELRRARSDHLPEGLPRHPKLSANLLDRLPVLDIYDRRLFAIDSTRASQTRLPLPLGARWTTRIRGSPLGADHLDTGSFFDACSQRRDGSDLRPAGRRPGGSLEKGRSEEEGRSARPTGATRPCRRRRRARALTRKRRSPGGPARTSSRGVRNRRARSATGGPGTAACRHRAGWACAPRPAR